MVIGGLEKGNRDQRGKKKDGRVLVQKEKKGRGSLHVMGTEKKKKKRPDEILV